MRVFRPISADEFLRQSEPLRAREPFRTNVVGSVATSVATGNSSYLEYFWWVVEDESGEVIGMAMRTAPHGMILSPMPAEAAAELAREVAIHDDSLPDVAGPTAVVAAFLDEYKRTKSGGSFRESRLEGRQLLYALGELISVNTSGVMVQAVPDDFDFALNWYQEFDSEAKLHMPNLSSSVRSILDRNSLRFWLVNGERVSMAGFAPLVETPSGTVGRIGPVYTPPEHRRKGYAGALTAAVSQELLDLGAKVMLYTDAANPTSNGVYQRIGFEQIDQNEKIEFLAVDV